jgi:anaerobic selenocysteine-containing dehydrogenase
MINPQEPTAIVTGHSTDLSCQYHQVKPGGDIALLLELCKRVFAADDAGRPGGQGVIDKEFITEHTNCFEEFEQHVRSLTSEEIEQVSGLTRVSIEAAGDVYVEAKNTIGICGIGLTQHVHGSEDITTYVNLLLMKGNIRRKGSGIFPLRGHSNVQGQRTVGIAEKPELALLDRLAALFDFEPPREQGWNTVDACQAILSGEARAFLGLGRNFLRAVPEQMAMEEAWSKLGLTLQVATKLNRSHLFNGDIAYHLPCLARSERDNLTGEPQVVSMEDSLSCVHGSVGKRKPVSPHDVNDRTNRRVAHLEIVPFDLPDGCVAGYYPELNPLVPLSHHDQSSKTPTYKPVPVRIERQV